MTLEEQLQRQTNINLQLRKRLETCRRDTVEYCAKFCEDHVETYGEGGSKMKAASTIDGLSHTGEGYAKALRGIIGK